MQPFAVWLAVAIVGLTISAFIGVLNIRADRRSDPFIRAPQFERLPGCPASVSYLDKIPRRCVDERYRMRRSAERYGLGGTAKTFGWLRVGNDAALIQCAWGASCYVVRVKYGVFPVKATRWGGAP